MKKLFIIGTLATLALVVFGVVGYAYAQSREPGSSNRTTGYGCGMDGAGYQQANGDRQGRGMMGSSRMGYGADNQGYADCPMADGDEIGMAEYAPLHDDMYAAYAQALGITPEALETRLQAGDTLWTIAQEQGLTGEQFQEMMTTTRTEAVNQAVAAGIITQAQADFMLDHMDDMMGNGYGPSFGPGNRGCPYSPGSQPEAQP
jgi:hypothetical protein